MHAITDANWWVVPAAALAYYLLGALWFTPLFGRAWDRSIGHDRSAANGRFPVPYYLVPLLSALIVTSVLAVILDETQQEGVLGSTTVGAALGLCLAAATLTNALTPHTPRPYLFAGITGSYHIVGCAIVGAALGMGR